MVVRWTSSAVLVAATSSDLAKSVAFAKQAGWQGSYFEGAVFDMLLGHERGTGISAAQLLQEANAQGIPTHTVTTQNIQTALPRRRNESLGTLKDHQRLNIVREITPQRIGTGYVAV